MEISIIIVCFVFLTVYSADAGEYLSVLKIDAKADKTAPVKDLGSTYGSNKRRYVDALKKAGLYDAYLALAVAIDMQETNTFNPADYDHSKTSDSTNYSAFNFNRDEMTRLGIQVSDSFNTWAGIDSVATACKKMVTDYGVNGFLNYQRGGYAAWKDGHSYDAAWVIEMRLLLLCVILRMIVLSSPTIDVSKWTLLIRAEILHSYLFINRFSFSFSLL